MEYQVLTQDTRIWITEEEARFNCPKLLSAFKNDEDQSAINEDPRDKIIENLIKKAQKKDLQMKKG